jgi:hypothetical protein
MTRNLRARDPLRAKQAVHTVCILKRLRRASHACRHIRTRPRRPATTRNLQARDPSRAKEAVHTACIITRPRLFVRSAGRQHRLHPHAPATLRALRRLSTPPTTICTLKRPRLFASQTGCPHRLHPQGLATLRALRRLSTPPASSIRRLYLLRH